MFRILAFLSLGIFVSGCAASNKFVPPPAQQLTSKTSTSAHPMGQTGEDQTDGGGSCPDPGTEMDSNPSSPTYGTCIPLPSSSETVPCNGMCNSNYCDMVCQQWYGYLQTDPFGGQNFNSGLGGAGVVDYCADPNHATDVTCLVATIPPVAGLNCDDSTVKLGTSNLPGGTSGWGTTVTNIFGLQNASGETYGWLYQNAHQDLFFQRNPADTALGIAALAAVLKDIPGIGDILNALMTATTNPVQLTADQATNIEYGLQNSGFKVHHCFSGQLPPPPPPGG